MNSKPILIAITAMALMAALVYAQYVPGAKPTSYTGCYPNACVGQVAHWPFSGQAPLALVASGSPAYGDYYNITNQLQYLGILSQVNPSFIQAFKKNYNGTTAIRIGFTQYGEFVAMLANGTAGGISMASYNKPNMFSTYEMWATNNIFYINPSDWVNGWTLSVNITIPQAGYFIIMQMYAVYSNRTTAGGGRGVVFNLTKVTPQSSVTPLTLSQWPTKWIWQPLSSTPLQIIYDSPRLLIARGSSYWSGSLAFLDPGLDGYYLTAYVNYTLVFPKAFPYAIIYYNYTVKLVPGSKLLPYTALLQDVAFSIRYELDQLNGAGYADTANITIFPVTLQGVEGNLTLAVPPAPFNNVTFFSLVWPGVTEFSVNAKNQIVPGILPDIKEYYNFTLPTGTKINTGKNIIPFVILQNKTSVNRQAPIGQIVTYSGGFMFVYGLTLNATNWVANKAPDAYIQNLLTYTIFQLKSAPYAPKYSRGYIAVPSLGHIYDVLGAAMVSQGLDMYNSYSTMAAVDIAPLPYASLSGTSIIYNLLGIGNFLGINMNGTAVLLAQRSSVAPWFVDQYSRAALRQYLFVNGTMKYCPAAGSFIATVGGPTPNLLTRYAQDFAWWSPFIAAYSSGVPAFFNPAMDYVANPQYLHKPLTTVWNKLWQPVVTTTWPPGPNQIGYGVISVSVDPNGTVILQVWGANAQDTYWTAYLLWSGSINVNLQAPGTYIVQIRYGNVTLPAGYTLYYVTPYQHIATSAFAYTPPTFNA